MFFYHVVPFRWETQDDWCHYVKKNDVYKSGPRLLDLMDAHVYDYLIGNADRWVLHICETVCTCSIIGSSWWVEIAIVPVYNDQMLKLTNVLYFYITKSDFFLQY